jgi:hypothetical protein
MQTKRKESKHTITENCLITRKTASEEEWKKRTLNQSENSSRAAINPYPSIITLVANRLNSPIKKHRLPEWIFKNPQYSTISNLQGTHIRFKDIHRLKVNEWKKVSHIF